MKRRVEAVYAVARSPARSSGCGMEKEVVELKRDGRKGQKEGRREGRRKRNDG